MPWSPDDKSYSNFWQSLKDKKKGLSILAVLIPVVLFASFYLDIYFWTKVVILDINYFQIDRLEVILEENVTRTVIFFVKNIGRYNAFFKLNWEPNDIIVEMRFKDNFLFVNEMKYVEAEVLPKHSGTLRFTVIGWKA